IGFESAKSVMIISEDGKTVADKIFEELGRTVTFMHGEGLVSNSKKDILYCVITRAEVYDLKRIIDSVPGSTFTTISDVSEIVGNHIKTS
ncbi:MAG: YitT family protein, partial [Lachnospiraceae bacterium]|nr:YitT family protein [Lachnospiraceae bacterium]